jgi:hypothetical protein
MLILELLNLGKVTVEAVMFCYFMISKILISQ